ncbi:MAG: hypothetical protein Q8L39_15040 [Burkholderiales bacterium]|nr:hypothetical protein [Burkholderiales bacterium]
MMRITLLLALALSVVGLTSVAAQPSDSTQKYPNVVAVKVQSSGVDTFNFDATVSSPYDSAQRYADAFRVMGKDGQVFGERKLLHDHADEQPFTRDLYFVKIPRGVRVVVLQARDQKYGYGGKTVEVALPGR